MAVHDSERRRLDDAFALMFGNALPRVARTRRVETDPVGTDAFRVRRREPAERLQTLRKLPDHLLVVVHRCEAGDEIHAAVVAQVQHARLDTTDGLKGADIRAEIA